MPVVEEDRTLVGLITEFDLLRVMDQGEDVDRLAATDIMTRDVAGVTEEMPIKDVVHLLQECHFVSADSERQGSCRHSLEAGHPIRICQGNGQLLALARVGGETADSCSAQCLSGAAVGGMRR